MSQARRGGGGYKIFLWSNALSTHLDKTEAKAVYCHYGERGRGDYKKVRKGDFPSLLRKKNIILIHDSFCHPKSCAYGLNLRKYFFPKGKIKTIQKMLPKF